MIVYTSGTSLTRSRFSHEYPMTGHFKDLMNDDHFAHAVRSAIEVIGEAAINVPDWIKSENPDVP